jgi:HEAT repeat protein
MEAQELSPACAKLQSAAPAAVIAALESEDVYLREVALAKIAREDLSPELTRAAAEAVAAVRLPGVKAQLIAVLAERGDASVAPAVRAALKDADPTVRAAAAQACGLFKDVPAADALFDLLGGGEAEAAREALRRIPNPAIDDRLVALLAGGGGTNRVMALDLLAARRYGGVFELALDKGLFGSDPALAKAAAGAIRAYAPAGGFERVLDFALALPAPSAELLAGTLSVTLDEAADRAACERRVGRALASCGAAHAPLLTGLLAASQGAEALSALSKRLESADLEARKDAVRNLGKWNSEAALVPLVLAARREADAGAQTLAWRAVLDIVKRADKIADFYQPVSAIHQAIWYAPRREEQVAALQALPLYHPKSWEVEWLLTKVETEKPELAEEAGRVKDALVPPFSGLLGR